MKLENKLGKLVCAGLLGLTLGCTIEYNRKQVDNLIRKEIIQSEKEGYFLVDQINYDFNGDKTADIRLIFERSELMKGKDGKNYAPGRIYTFLKNKHGNYTLTAAPTLTKVED